MTKLANVNLVSLLIVVCAVGLMVMPVAATWSGLYNIVGGNDNSIVTFENGRAAVAYRIDTGLKYAEMDASGQWRSETVVASPGAGYSAALAIDPKDGGRHIAYYDKNTQLVNYASRDSPGWNVETIVPFKVNAGSSVALAFDGNGDPHISFIDKMTGRVGYVTNHNQGWELTHVDHGHDVTSIAIDSQNEPHIVFMGEENLTHAYIDHTTQEWKVQTVDKLNWVSTVSSSWPWAGGYGGYYYYPKPSIAISWSDEESREIIGIAYMDAKDDGAQNNFAVLKFVKGWYSSIQQNHWNWDTPEELNATKIANTADSRPIALDIDGSWLSLTYHITYYTNFPTKALIRGSYPFYDYSGRKYETLTPISGKYVSLAIDGYNRPYASYNYLGSSTTANYIAIKRNSSSNTLTGITPKSGVRGKVVATSITGTGFLPADDSLRDEYPPTAILRQNSPPYQVISGVRVAAMTPTRMVAMFQIPPDANLGLYDLIIKNPDAGASQRIGLKYFTITAQAPTVTSITPNLDVAPGTVNVIIKGSGFQPGATARLIPVDPVPIQSPYLLGILIPVTSNNPDTITGTVNILSSAASASYYWDVEVCNPDGQCARLNSGLNLKPPAGATPVVERIEPSTAENGTTVHFFIYGKNFLSNPVASGLTGMLNKTGFRSIGMTGLQTIDLEVHSSREIEGWIQIPAACRDQVWNVTVRNPNGKVGTLVDGFRVRPPCEAFICMGLLPDLILTGIGPTSGTAGFNVIVHLNGDGFSPDVNARLVRGSDVIQIQKNTVTQTLIDGTVTIPADAATGSWDVVIDRPDLQYSEIKNGFQVNPATGPPLIPPTISGIDPSSVMAGSSDFTLKVTGTNYVSGSKVRWNGGDLATTYVSPTSLSAVVPKANIAASGTAAITVSNPGGTTSNSVPLNIYPKEPLAVTGITPNEGKRGVPVAITNLAGTGFISPVKVNLTRSSSWGTQIDIPANTINVQSSHKITCGFTIDAAKPTGKYNVKVTNPDGTSSSLANGFNVTA